MKTKENLDLDAYMFTVRPLTEEEGGGFLIEYRDIPGCISDGKTVEEAIRNGRDALKSTLLTLNKELRGRIPQPGEGASGQWRQRVPRSLHARLIERADDDGVSLNTLVTSMIAAGLASKSKLR